MHDGITRRDFLNGASVALGASLLAPWSDLLAAGWDPGADYYPPAKTGLRGTHDGAWETMHARVGGANQLVVGVAVLALVVGAIGILAVMLISVRERRREIGLRRALGAKRGDIKRQFMVESTMLAAVGGVGGVVVGLVAAVVASLVGPWELVFSWRAAVAGVATSTVLGTIVGVIPAVRAARMEPIAALRGE
jgi:ABC-type antimicrobial peptide transport system permease subunit